MSEVIAENGCVAAHYEYAPFGAITARHGSSALANPWRFSSEYAEDDTATVYYNYRHYAIWIGRWNERDPIEEYGGVNAYGFYSPIYSNDILGLKCRSDKQKPGYEPSVNGCGTDGGFPVPDSYFGLVNFTPCCNDHDRCYGTCGSNRADCDSELSDCMKNACDNYFTLPITWHERAACRVTASVYWGTLRVLGGEAYESAQDEACDENECCDEK